jgi:hypothetical protein
LQLWLCFGNDEQIKHNRLRQPPPLPPNTIAARSASAAAKASFAKLTAPRTMSVLVSPFATLLSSLLILLCIFVLPGEFFSIFFLFVCANE